MKREHRTEIVSGRLRGQWFARCSCGWESDKVWSKREAEDWRAVHEEEVKHADS